MTDRTGDVRDHWTRKGVLERIDAVLAELGHDPEHLTPEILATVDHLHTGGLKTTRDQAERLNLGPDVRVLDIGCGTGGPARYLAGTYGCRVEGIDLTPELVETGRILTARCGLSDGVNLQIGNALDLPFPDRSFDVVWCQNVTMNIDDKAGFLSSVYRVLAPGGLFTSTEFSTGPGGDILYPVMWAYDSSTNFLDPEETMRTQFDAAGFRIREWTNYTDEVIAWLQQLGAPKNKLTNRLVFGEDTAERAKNGSRNLTEKRIIYWMITAECPQ